MKANVLQATAPSQKTKIKKTHTNRIHSLLDNLVGKQEYEEEC